MIRRPPRSTLFPSTTLSRPQVGPPRGVRAVGSDTETRRVESPRAQLQRRAGRHVPGQEAHENRKSTRLNSSHLVISYAVFCLKKKRNRIQAHHVNLPFVQSH